ncbi:MAG: hypothetical protein EPO21_11205 [Chloroflexota bacterium]|nr:MAG: hypothetical protein EPO21_11205 [Chloroflexota bacterium]
MVLQRGTDSSFLVAKFLPEVRRNVIHRQRLFARMSAGLKEGKVILVVAAPGYGKSTLLASFVASQDLPAIWYRTDKSDADPVVLVNGLLTAVDRCLPDEVAETGGWFGAGPEPWRGPLAALLAALGRDESRELLLLIDDFDTVSCASSANTCLEALLSYLPPNVRLCVASRAEPKIGHIARLRQYGGLLEFHEWDLSFSEAEIQEFLDHYHGLTVDAKQLGQLVARTAGWPAVLPMVAQRISEHGADSAAELIDLGVARKSIYDYFAQCIVDGQPSHVQDFLERSSILQQLTPQMCETILEVTDARETLEHLHQNHIFVSVVSDQEDVYTYHSLFREFLQTRLRRRIGEAGVAALHRAAARYFAGLDLVEVALHHAFKAADWPAAAALIRKGASGAIRAVNLETVLRWIGGLPEPEVESDPWLLLYKGRVLRIQDQVGQAVQVLSRARAVAGPQPDRALGAQLLYELGALSYLEHRYDECDRQLHAALDLAVEGADALLAAKAWAALTVSYAAQDRIQEAAAAATQSLTCVPHIPDDATRSFAELRVIRHLSWAYLSCGRINEAIETAQQTCYSLSSDPRRNAAQASVLCMLGAARAAKGELETALEDLCVAKEAGDKYDSPVLSSAAIMAKATTLAMMNRLAEAEDVYQAVDPSRWREADLAYLRLLQGRLDEAASIARRQLQQAETRASRGDAARLLTLLAAIELQQGNLSASKHMLSRAADEFTRLDLRYYLAGVQLYQAHLYFLTGHEDKGTVCLKESFEYLAAEGYYNFFPWHPEVVTSLCAEALRRGIVPHYVRALSQRRLGQDRHLTSQPISHEANAEHYAQTEQTMSERNGRVPNAGMVSASVVLDCKDQDISSRILAALSHGWITSAGLARLRTRYCLTWREIDIFVQYYLQYYHLLGQRSGQEEAADSSPRREQLARSLNLTDNTLRLHISNIRRKIGVLGARDGLAIFRWALEEGITARGEGVRSA